MYSVINIFILHILIGGSIWFIFLSESVKFLRFRYFRFNLISFSILSQKYNPSPYLQKRGMTKFEEVCCSISKGERDHQYFNNSVSGLRVRIGGLSPHFWVIFLILYFVNRSLVSSELPFQTEAGPFQGHGSLSGRKSAGISFFSTSFIPLLSFNLHPI